jgi:hypothetical protein
MLMTRNYLDEMLLQADSIDARYRKAVEQLLAANMADSEPRSSLFSIMKGVFPGELLQCRPELKGAWATPQGPSIPTYYPELHALNYEWYFTSQTAENLVQEFVSPHGLTVCLGTPTVASAAVRKDKNIILVDQNPAVLTRFPGLSWSSELHLMNAADAGRLSLKADALIFDSPWYLGDILAWLSASSCLVRLGGTIVFALYPSLIRPTAQLERDFVLEVASAIGDVKIMEDSLAYETPLFEAEALKACGFSFVGEWRRGDTVVIRDTRPLELSLPNLPCRSEVDGQWESFLIGSQVLKLRAKTQQESTRYFQSFLEPVGESFAFASVSVRHDRRNEADLWTSRNRVAKTRDRNTLRSILRQLQAGVTLHDALAPHANTLGLAGEDQMRAILLLEN